MKVRQIKLRLLRVVAIGIALLAVRGALAGDFAEHHYPEFTYLPAPSDYGGRVFRLSQRFPTERPAAAHKPGFISIDYKKDCSAECMAMTSADMTIASNITWGKS